MKYRSVGKSGLKISEVALGSWVTDLKGTAAEDVAKETVKLAYDSGVNFFDCADAYSGGAAERFLGKTLKQYPRKELVISSKVYFPTGEGVNDRGLSRKHIFESVDQTLKNMQTDYLDMYFCHRFDETTDLTETLRAMSDLVAQGKVLYYGVSEEWGSARLEEAQRIIDLRISPINVSVQATEPQLRRTLLGNKDADKSLEYMRAFGEAGIEMNGQIVVCPGWNDGEHLRRSIEDLMDIGFNSCSIVPVGLTKFRKGLARLEPVTKEKAGEIIDLVDEYGAKCLEKYGTRMFFCADEFYIKAERPLPDEEYYEEYQQLDNGVGMLRSTMNEFLSGLEDAESGDVASFTVATGKAAEPFIARLVAEAKKKFPQLRGEVVGIVNDFFGHSITVSGLVTAQDLIAQLKDRPTLGERVLIPANMLRHGEGVFLDDYTVEQVEQALGRRLTISETDGYSLCDAIFRQEP